MEPVASSLDHEDDAKDYANAEFDLTEERLREEPDVEEAFDHPPEEGDGIDAKLEGEMVEQAIANAMVEGNIPWMEGAKKKELVLPDYNPVNTLLTKLELWLLQQPEWAVILAAPRKTRRQAINLVSKRLLTIPNRYGG